MIIQGDLSTYMSVGQFVPKWDKSGTFSDPKAVHFGGDLSYLGPV